MQCFLRAHVTNGRVGMGGGRTGDIVEPHFWLLLNLLVVETFPTLTRVYFPKHLKFDNNGIMTLPNRNPNSQLFCYVKNALELKDVVNIVESQIHGSCSEDILDPAHFTRTPVFVFGLNVELN